MNSEIENTNLNIIEEKENFNWILGNLFFTSVIVLIAFFQLYVYYHNGKEARYICFGSFFFIFIGLYIVSKNICTSLLTAMLAANLLFKCGNVQILNRDKEESKKEVKEIKSKNKPDNKPKNKKKKQPNVEQPSPDLEQKKSKDTYVTGSNFDPYLTGDKNNFAYPAAPDILKFQS